MVTDIIPALERLAQLRASGILTQAEFDQQKRALLDPPAIQKKARPPRRLSARSLTIIVLVMLGLVYVKARIDAAHSEATRLSSAGGAVPVANPTDGAVGAASSEATPYFQVEATITDATLANPWNSTGNFAADSPNRQDACPLGQVSIINRSSETLSLDIIQLDGDSTVAKLPELAPGMMAKYQPPRVGQFLIRRDQGNSAAGAGFYLLNVVNCPPND